MRYTVVSACLISCGVLSVAVADTGAFTIVNDATLNAQVAATRADFLAIKPYVSRLDIALLLPNTDGTWRRAAYNPEAIAYPASCCKLAYMAAAMYWERTNGHAYDHLDWCVRPMITVSDNVATGHVVDAITGAPNYSPATNNATFQSWYAKRLYTHNFLSARGLLENQILFNKTYPTNSGSSPSGAESLALNTYGGNRMQPKCSASLMLEIIKGAIEPGANAYMRDLLESDRWGANSEFGFGLPPGTVYQSKEGLAYDTLEDIAYIVLPNNQEFILAAFCNGYTGPEPNHPLPYDGSLLGVFAEMLIDRLGLNTGCPPKLVIDNTAANVTITGSWSVVTDQTVDYDMYGTNYLSASSTTGTATASVSWNLNLPSNGKYEVCVWAPQKTTGATVTYSVNHSAGTANVTVDERYYGGRWYRLGDWDFDRNGGSVVLTNKASSSGKVVMADAVKVTKWPGTGSDCLIPGDFDCDNDVDLEDFGRFQACLTGRAAPITDYTCRNADLNSSQHIDGYDLILFRRCLTAANVVGNSDCTTAAR